MDFTQHSPSSFAVSPVAEGVQRTSLTARTTKIDGNHSSGSGRLWASPVSTYSDIHTPTSSTCSLDCTSARLLVGEVQNAHRIRETNHFDLCIPIGKDGGKKGEGRKQCNLCRGQRNFSFGLEI